MKSILGVGLLEILLFYFCVAASRQLDSFLDKLSCKTLSERL